MLGLRRHAVRRAGGPVAPLVAPYDPIATSWARCASRRRRAHWFGTDELGRDILSRVICGARASLFAGIVSVGIALRSECRSASRRLPRRLDRRADLALRPTPCWPFPFLILAIALAAFLGPSLINAMIAIGVSATPLFIRLTRAQVLAVKFEDYVEAARAVGNPHWRIALRHILPNILPPLIVQATLALPRPSSPRQAFLSGPGPAAARAALGHHAQPASGRRRGPVDGDLAGPSRSFCCAVLQPAGRRPARRAGSAA